MQTAIAQPLSGARRVQLHPVRSRTTCHLEWTEARRLLTELETEGQYNTALMCAAGFYFGLRVSDILRLKWGQVRRPKFTAVEGKTGKTRVVTVHAEFAALLDRYLAAIPARNQPAAGAYIFTPQRSHRHGQPISVTAANKRFAAALDRHGIDTANKSTHTMRKTFGRRVWEKNGKSEAALVLLSQIFNHQSIAVTRRYLGITADEISAAYISL